MLRKVRAYLLGILSDTIMDAIVAEDHSRPLWPYSHSDGWAAGVDAETNLRNDSQPLVMRDGRVPDSSQSTSTTLARNSVIVLQTGRLWIVGLTAYSQMQHMSEYGWIGAESFDVFRNFSVARDWNTN